MNGERAFAKKLSNCQFVCDETDTKNHNHKFLLITITVVSITSATVLCNWDGMASMSTNSFCQSSLIFHKTALVNCQLEWIVYLNLFFLNQSDPYLIYLQPCLEFRNSGKHWKALLVKPQKTVKRFDMAARAKYQTWVSTRSASRLEWI